MKVFSPSLRATGLTLIWVCAATRIMAVDYHVSTAQELQNALTLAAANGANDTITISNGYYVGNFNYNSSEDRDLTIQAAAGVPNTDIAIDGDGGGRALNITCSGTDVVVVVQGVTFLRDCGDSLLAALRIDAGVSGTIIVDDCRFLSPQDTRGAGLEIVQAQEASVTSCSVTGLPLTGRGRGIAVTGVSGEVLVRSCVLSTNYSGPSGGGVYVSGGSPITISSNSFIGNQTYFYGSQYQSGGGAWIAGSSGATISMTGNTFIGNSASFRYAGGAYVSAGSGTSIVADNTFKGNTSGSGYEGGGLYFNASSTSFLTNNVFESNTAGYGGGASVSGSPTISGNSFIDNSATSASGSQGGGAIYLSGSPQVAHNIFTANSAAGDGGALYSSSSPTLSRNVFESNSAGRNGGAMFIAGPTVVITDNLIAGNSQSGGAYSGGGIFVDASATLDLLNNTITQNSAAGDGGGVRFKVDGVVEVLNVFNNIIWGNTASGSGADVFLTGTGASKDFQFNDAHDVAGIWTLFDNNIDLAPEFFDPVNGDYHIQSTSSCKDAGTNGVANLSATDLDGEPRIVDGTVDMGCYEFSTAAAHPADVDTNFVLTATEFTDYAAAWKSGQSWNSPPVVIPADYVTRAGYLMTNGGTYHNDGSARPVNWKIGP